MGDMYIQCGDMRIAEVQGYLAKRGSDIMFHLILENVYLTAGAIREYGDLDHLGVFSFIVKKHDRIIRYEDCFLQAVCGERGASIGKMWVNSYRRTEEALPT